MIDWNQAHKLSAERRQRAETAAAWLNNPALRGWAEHRERSAYRARRAAERAAQTPKRPSKGPDGPAKPGGGPAGPAAPSKGPKSPSGPAAPPAPVPSWKTGPHVDLASYDNPLDDTQPAHTLPYRLGDDASPFVPVTSSASPAGSGTPLAPHVRQPFPSPTPAALSGATPRARIPVPPVPGATPAPSISTPRAQVPLRPVFKPPAASATHPVQEALFGQAQAAGAVPKPVVFSEGAQSHLPTAQKLGDRSIRFTPPGP
ncbi:hypothetical protein ACWDTT_15980 [Streptosporangium sandarakinum]